jgi:hypothetical protein
MSTSYVNDGDLAAALVDLGTHLDHPAGDGLAAAVDRRLRAAPPRRARVAVPARRAVLAVAAALVLVLVGVLVTVAPAREAVAHWFGIGAVSLRSAPPDPVPSGSDPVPGPGAGAPVDRARIQAAIRFPVRYPTDPAAGAPVAGAVDERLPGGLVVVTYPSFTLVQVRSGPRLDPVMAKMIGPGARLERTTVAGAPAFWITGEQHQVAYLDEHGNTQKDTVRQAGDVLLWAADGVTYRIEGLHDRDEAVRIGASLR